MLLRYQWTVYLKKFRIFVLGPSVNISYKETFTVPWTAMAHTLGNFYCVKLVLMDYYIIMERKLCSNDPVIFTGSNVSSWYGHLCQTGQRVGVRGIAVPCPLSLGLGMQPTTPPHYICNETTKAKTHA
jgi:hypothetical protein